MHEYSPMVGRVEEIGAIRTALDYCRTGGAPPVLVGGEAGMGKSHLIGAGLRDWDGAVLRASSHPGGGPYAEISRILRVCIDSFGEEIVDPAGAALLAESSFPDGGGAVETLTDGFPATLRRVSGRVPTVVVLEDPTTEPADFPCSSRS